MHNPNNTSGQRFHVHQPDSIEWRYLMSQMTSMLVNCLELQSFLICPKLDSRCMCTTVLSLTIFYLNQFQIYQKFYNQKQMAQMQLSIGRAEMQQPVRMIQDNTGHLQIQDQNQPILMANNVMPVQIREQAVKGMPPLREQSYDNLNYDPTQNENGNLQVQPGHKIQRTQLTKLKPAGGSTMNITEVPPDQIQDFEAQMKQEADALQVKRRESVEVEPNSRMVKKRGLTRKFLTEDEERQYMIYKMITDLFDFELLKKQETFAIKRYKESLYRGEVIDQHRHGLGICVYENGRVYEGTWEKDKRHGKGYERFSNGNQYLGDYEYGRVSGKGLYTWKNGDTYDGEWLDGIKHGYGVWKGNQGDSYIGQWSSNKAHGYGVHEWANGDRYEGEWKYCLRHGQGSDTFANGDCYLGEYNYGKANGYGQYKWANGNTYSGIFHEGMKQGKGVWKKSAVDDNTNMYEGEYLEDMKHGQGEFKWASGGFYRGGYLHDIKCGYGEMYWADGSIYRGQWDKGIQNGLGIMIFSNGTRKAGIFKDNVLIELLIEQSVVDKYNDAAGGFPEAFKQELKEYIGLMNPKENNEQYLDKVLKENKQEDKSAPNVLLNMQEIANAPWQDQGGNPGMTRDQYIDFVKEQELLEEQQNFEPPRMTIPTVKEFGVQVDPPQPPSPKPPSLHNSLQGQMLGQMPGQMLNQSSQFMFDPHQRMTPVDPNDPNDHRNYASNLPPVMMKNNNTQGDLIYHDFDYVGYQRSFKGSKAGDSPRQKSMKSVGTIMSPRISRAPSKAGQVNRKENHGINRRPKYDDGKLPDIVKRGPINQKKNRTIVGLSLQNTQGSSQPRVRKVVNKRNSIETTVRSNKPKSQARGAILKAQQAAQKFPQPLKVPRSSYKPEYAMPRGQQSNRTLSVPPQYSGRGRSESRGSVSPSRHNTALKPLLNQRAWIPGGHPNSIGRNKLASLGKPLNLEYQKSVRSTNERSHSHGRSYGHLPSQEDLLNSKFNKR